MARKPTAADFTGDGSSDSEDFADAQQSMSKMVDLEEDDFADFSDEDRVFQTKKSQGPFKDDSDSEEEPENENEPEKEASDQEPEKQDEEGEMFHEQRKRSKKLKKLTPEQLAKEQKKIKKTGVCYLSSIPPYMKPVKLRSVLLRFGKLDRVFLKPEDPSAYQKRKKYGGNKKKKYTEGWVEFVNKKDAKLCAETMNGNILGGKKSSYYHDDIMNIKYLPGFKWLDLTQQIAKENEIRQAKLAMEISQQQKLNKTFVTNVERSKKRKRHPTEDRETDFQFDQRDIASTRHDAKLEFKKPKNSENLDSVLSKVF